MLPALLAVLTLLAPGAARAPDDPPNVLLVIADDLDPDHPGFAGNPRARTPSLDALAARGATFRVLRVEPVCRPSLATLLSGRWPHQHGIVHNQTAARLDPAGALPARLRERGYATFCGGKFWEGDPHAYGFDAPPEHDERFAREGPGQEELFRFLRERADAGPWFVWWAPSLPHVPHRPRARFQRALADAEIAVPAWFRGPPAEYVAAERAALAMEAWLDAELGKLLRELETLGERDSTLVVFLADNGWSTALPAKGTPFEKGVRSPLVVVAPGAAPRAVDALVDLVDVTATVLDYAGAPADPAAPGRSLRAWLAGERGPERELLCGVAYGRSGDAAPAELAYALHARDARWKYVRFLRDVQSGELTPGGKLVAPWSARAGTEALYDLADDPCERVDLSARPEHAERLAALRAGAQAWWSASGGGPLSPEAPR